MNIEQALQNVTGLSVKDFISSAIEGGWTTELPLKQLKEQDPQFWHNKPWTSEILLDPLAWRAVGKVEGLKWTVLSMSPDMPLYFHHRFIDELHNQITN